MRWMRMGFLHQMSPLGTLVAGLAIGAVGIPILRNGVRKLAYTATKGAIAVSDTVKNTGGKIGEEWKQIVAEIKAEKLKEKAAVKTGLRGAGVGVIRTGMNLAEQAKDTIEGIKGEWRELVEEARSDLKEAGAAVTAAASGTVKPTAVEDREEQVEEETGQYDNRYDNNKNEI